MINYFQDFIEGLKNYIVEYIDIDFTLWLSWLLMPLIITFLLPLVIVAWFYITALILYIYKWHWNRLLQSLETEAFWSMARTIVAVFWDAHGYVWHGYEVKGLENIPDDSAALIIYYHGAIPVDLYYFNSKVFLFKNRMVNTVADRFLFNIPGWSIIAEALQVFPGTLQTCISILRKGNLLAISPGGVYEAQFGNPYYRLLWKGRLGFAKVALEAKVPVIPMFTQNLREGFRCVTIGRRFWMKLYSLTRFPFAPVYGGIPVKFITHIGPPIPYDPDLTPEQLSAKVASAIEDLRDRHQRIPGSFFRALLDRIYLVPKKDDRPKES